MNRIATMSCLLALAATAAAQPADSVRLALRRIAVREARIDVERTALWRRFLPSVTLSASLAAGALFVAAEGTAIALPRDAYRLSAGLSLDAILDGAPHERALARCERAELEQLLDSVAIAAESEARASRAALYDSLRVLREEEVHLREGLVRFQETLFGQGECSFDDVARARLALLAARAAVLQVREGRP